jgi:O-acetylhomoserine/O-acetylserine sulfhydrylase-like pyridoxal-dependent enzyme
MPVVQEKSWAGCPRYVNGKQKEFAMTDQPKYSPGLQHRIDIGNKIMAERAERVRVAKKWKFDTIAVHGLYHVQEAIENNQGSVIEPCYLSASQAYRDSDELEAGLAYLIPNWCYSRIANPTNYYLEWTLALMEGYGSDAETSCCATASGMSAIALVADAFLIKRKKGSYEPINFVSTANIYGGTFQQWSVRKMRERDIEVRWVVDPTNLDEWVSKIDKNTRFLYGEAPSNPGLAFFDIKAVADLAHERRLPLIVDTTIASPALLRPIQHGADIVIHSATKIMTSSGFGISGAVISRKNLVSDILEDEAKADFATWFKFWPYRDHGPSISPFTALMMLNENRTLRSRIDLFCRNNLTVAEFLNHHPKIERVDYLGLPHHPLHELAKKYMILVDSEDDYGEPVNRYGYLMSFRVKGGRDATRKMFDNLKLVMRATDLGRIKSVATIPAISTHSQQGEEARAMADIPQNQVRLSVGGEHPDDIIADLDQALTAI